MDYFLIAIGLILCIVGILGSIIPGLPGHPLNYIALLLLYWVNKSVSVNTLIIYGLLTAVVLVLDYFIPILTAKKYGATRPGIIGSMIGMVVGFFFTPIGMILGVFLGAVLGDLYAGRNGEQATKSGIATLFGTVLSIGFKLVLSILMTVLFCVESFKFIMDKF